MKIVKNVLKTHRTKVSKHFIMFFMFLAIVLGKGTDVVAQERQQMVDDLSHVDFSNPTITTNCCTLKKQRLDSVMNNAPIVFEGRMLRHVFGPSGDWYLFEIEKVYRGGERLQAGTVEIVSRRPEGVGESYFGGFGLSEWFIVFAKEVEGGGTFDANNSVKLEIFYHNEVHASYFAEVVERMYDNRGEVYGYRTPYYCSSLGFYSRTKQEVYNFLSSYGLFPTVVSKADTLKTLSWREIEEARKRQENINKYYRTPEEADSIIKERNKIRGFDLDSIRMKKRNGKVQKRGGDADLFLSVENIQYTNNSGNRFLEFDIMEKADV